MDRVVKLPTHLLPQADQAKAHADRILDQMVLALKGDLADGNDPTHLWWTLQYSFTHCEPTDLATGLAAAILQLASGTTHMPKPDLVDAAMTTAGRHRSRIKKHGHHVWSTSCQMCEATYPTITQSDALFLAVYHWAVAEQY